LKKLPLAAGLALLAACSDATSPNRVSTESLKPSATLASGNNTVVVSEPDIVRGIHNVTPVTNAWMFYSRDGGTGAFISGPGTPPVGSGSFQLSTPLSNDKGYLFNYEHIGTPLNAIQEISYSTYLTTASAASPSQVPALNIEVDVNGSDPGGFTTLVFEPVYNLNQGTVTTGSWQAWDAYASGNAVWWSSNPIASAPDRDTFVSWATILAANPNAVIAGGFGVNQGGGNTGVVGAADALRIAYGGNSITYNFEPDVSCYFTDNTTTHTRTLNGDCQTSHTILVPDGYTLDGDGHTITAVDPVGGSFTGGVIQNAGTSANVINLTLTASGLSQTCHPNSPVDTRLRGIFLNDASGTISNNNVSGLRQGLSGCQEGNAIDVRNMTGSTKRLVSIMNNVVSNYQKTGIVTNGLVSATITGNTITGDGPITYTAQNGIQIGFGATAIVKNNSVSGNNYTPASYVACGVLLYQADGVKASANTLFNNEKDMCNYGKGGGNVKPSN
jgi:hypothetical protein